MRSLSAEILRAIVTFEEACGLRPDGLCHAIKDVSDMFESMMVEDMSTAEMIREAGDMVDAYDLERQEEVDLEDLPTGKWAMRKVKVGSRGAVEFPCEEKAEPVEI